MKKYLDLTNEKGTWLATFRYEPSLDKFFLVLPIEKEIRIVNWDDIPIEIQSNFKRNNAQLDKQINHFTYPTKAQIQLTNCCNFNCKMCYASSNLYEKKELSLETLDNLFHNLKELGVLRVNLVGGEIFLRNDITEIVESAYQHHLLISCITNGLIPGMNVDKYKNVFDRLYAIQVSCNGLGDNYTNEYGFKNWELAKSNIFKTLQSVKNNTLSFVVTKDNVNDIPEFVRLAHCEKAHQIKFGSIIWEGKSNKSDANDYYSKIVPLASKLIKEQKKLYPNMTIDSQFDSPLEYSSETAYDNYRSLDFYFSPEGKDSLYVKSTGDIYPFPLLSEFQEFKLGNINDDLEKIWMGSEVLTTIRSIQYSNTECSNVCKNKMCGFWNRSYAYAWSGNMNGKVPCEYDL